MPHFFISSNDVKENTVKIFDKETLNHIVNSLRIRKGEKILLIDENRIQYEGTVKDIQKEFLQAEIEQSYPSKRFLEFDLSLAQSPLRSDKQNMIIEKATELGVNRVYPILTDNCALKKSVIENKIDKWQKIMAESSKQCERAYIPQCCSLTTLHELLGKNGELINNFDRILAFTERDAKIHVKKYLHTYPIKKDEKILVIIGPEGGFSQKEFDFFEEHQEIITLSLGELILRAETAVITAVGAIVL